jgi:hypothetical protein
VGYKKHSSLDQEFYQNKQFLKSWGGVMEMLAQLEWGSVNFNNTILI